MGFELPSWQSAAAGARPEAREPELYELGTVRQGWQHEASTRVEQHIRASFFRTGAGTGEVPSRFWSRDLR